MSIRKSADRLSLWTSDIRDEERLTHLGQILKHVFGLGWDQFVLFESHEDSSKKTGSFCKHLMKL